MIGKILKWRGVKLVFVAGKEQNRVVDLVYKITGEFKKVSKIQRVPKRLGPLSLITKDVVILSDQGFKTKDLSRFFNLFREVVMVVDSKKLKREKELSSLLTKKDSLLVNFAIKDSIAGKRMKNFKTYGLQKEADFKVMDVSEKEKINFKISHDGSIVPLWIEKEDDFEESIKRAIIAVATGVLLGINFVKLAGKLSE